MPSRIDPVDVDESDDSAVNERLRETTEAWYGDSAFFGAMAHRPPLLQNFMHLFETFAESARLSAELLELARLRVAAVHECAYCRTVRNQEVADAVAPREAAVLDDDINTEPLSDREALAVRLAEQMSRDPQRITDAFFTQLREEFTDETLIELLLFLSIEVGLDRFTVAIQLDTTDEGPYPTGLEYPMSRSDR
jgi:alkylhydroperoxidase family enzyme